MQVSKRGTGTAEVLGPGSVLASDADLGTSRAPRAPLPGRRRSRFPRWLRRGVVLLSILVVLEYVVVPELVGAGKNLDLLRRLHPVWLLLAVIAEAAALLAYAMQLRLLLHQRLRLSWLMRLVLTTTALGHVVPGGGAGSVGLEYQLLTAQGVGAAETGFVMATAAVGSAIVLNVMLWIALLVTIPLAGMHPLYVTIALVGLLALLAVAGLIYLFTRGEERAVRAVRSVGRRVPGVGDARAESAVRQISDAVVALTGDHALLRRTGRWAASNWLLDAASLWCCLAALGHLVNPVELFVAYGVANVLAVLPFTPAGLGVVEASAAALVVGFGTPGEVATLGVLGWRLLNFWLPIPVGAVAYLTLVVPRRTGAAAPAGRA